MTMQSKASKVTLVTGASSGIGQATAQLLAKTGYKVYGTSRRGGHASGRSFEMLPLDVTNDESVDAAVRKLMQVERRIDLLVNNAGFGVAPAGAEESSIEQARSIFDTNFFGIVRMTRAVVPHMRRQGAGRIINIGSVLGFPPMPYMALYSATKHAVAGYSESLDHKLRTQGIRVSVVEPAYINTPFDANLMQPDAPIDVYREIRARVERRVKEVLVGADGPEVVAEIVVKAATAAQPKIHYTPGLASRMRMLRRFGARRRAGRRDSQRPASPTVGRHQEQGRPMKAFVLERYGKKRALRSADMPTPALRDDEVLIEVHAAGVNLLDSKIRDGEFKLILPYRLPLVLGHDVAGVVVQAGPRVRQFKPGDEVYARPDDFRIGTFAEFVPVKEASLALKPSSLTMEEAASIPLVGLTAWQALMAKANLKQGQKVFIQAGSGGVGTFAIQLAKHLGATVATTTSAANVGLVKSLGADVVIDYKTQDFEDVLRDYDVVLNSQDRKTLEKSLRVLKAGGKLISISGPPDPEFGKEIAAPGFVKLVMRLISSGVRRKAQGRGIGYSFLFMKANGSQLREITRLIEAGAIRPVIDRVFPFESTNEALAYVEAGHAKGKVVVKIK